MPGETPRTLEFWLGRAGSGKTYACLESIAAEIRQQPRGRPLFFLVPEQATAQMEHSLVSRLERGGTTRARIVSFRRLALDALRARGGRSTCYVDDEMRALLVRGALRESTGQLRFFKLIDPARLSRAVAASIVELERYGWTPDRLSARAGQIEARAASPGLFDKLSDLGLVWRAYRRAISERGLSDSSIELDSAIEGLRTWDELEGARLWVDGFASFTFHEIALIEALLARVDSAAVALCLDPDELSANSARARVGSERAFEIIDRTRQALKERADAWGWMTKDIRFPRKGQPTRFSSSDALRHLESRALTRIRPEACPRELWDSDCAHIGHAPIQFVVAGSLRNEVISAARMIARLALENRNATEDSAVPFRWSDIAILTRDLEPYGPLIREIFPRFGIPYFLDERRALASHPLARLLLSSLRLAAEPTNLEAAMDYLKTGLSPLGESETISAIERLAAKRRLRGHDWRTLERWMPRRRREDEEPPQEEQARAESLFKAWNQAAASVDALTRALNEAKVSPARALWDFLVSLRAIEVIERWVGEAQAAGDEEAALLHREAWQATTELLERIEAAGAGSTEGRTDFTELRDAIETGFAASRARLIPPSLDRVIVGQIERSRTPEVRAAFVLGLVDGEFPRAYAEDAMLSDEDRRVLSAAGERIGPDTAERYSHERFLAYVALTRASELLVLSSPLSDRAGRPAAPSSFYRTALETFPWLQPSDVEQCVLPDEWAASIVQSYHAAVAGEDPSALGQALALNSPIETIESLTSANELFRRRAEATLEALGWPRESNLDPAVARAYWLADPTLPVTKLETYVHCAFKFFAERMLKLEIPEEPLPGPMELGNVRHRILHELYLRLASNGELRWGEVDLTRAARLIDEIAPRAAEIAMPDRGNDELSPLLVDHLAEEMKRFVGALREMGGRYGFAQVSAERHFGRHDPSPLRIPAGEGVVLSLTGSIDRVDRAVAAIEGESNADEILLLFDFKSGGRRLDPTRLFHGLDLQLAAYALALESEAAQNESANRASVAGLFYWPLSIGIGEAAGDGEEWAEPGSRAWFKKHHPVGLFDAAIARRLDIALSPDEPALAFNVRLTKSGKPYENSAGPLEGGRFRAYLDLMKERIVAEVSRIVGGDIRVRPSREALTGACDRCQFATVCRIASLGDSAFARFERVSFRELKHRLEASPRP